MYFTNILAYFITLNILLITACNCIMIDFNSIINGYNQSYYKIGDNITIECSYDLKDKNLLSLTLMRNSDQKVFYNYSQSPKYCKNYF